jgi:hypothetical protein
LESASAAAISVLSNQVGKGSPPSAIQPQEPPEASKTLEEEKSPASAEESQASPHKIAAETRAVPQETGPQTPEASAAIPGLDKRHIS